MAAPDRMECVPISSAVYPSRSLPIRVTVRRMAVSAVLPLITLLDLVIGSKYVLTDESELVPTRLRTRRTIAAHLRTGQRTGSFVR